MAGAELRPRAVRGLVPARPGPSLPRTGSRGPRAGAAFHGPARALHARAGGQRPDRSRGQDPDGRGPRTRRDRCVRHQDPHRVRRPGPEPVQLHPRDRHGHQPGRQPHRPALRRPVDRRPDAAQAVRHAGAEGALPAAPREGRDLRVRADRERCRLRPRGPRHDGDSLRGRHALRPERREALVHQRHHRRADGRDGPDRDRRGSPPSSSRPTGPASRWSSGSTSWGSRPSRTASSASPT